MSLKPCPQEQGLDCSELHINIIYKHKYICLLLTLWVSWDIYVCCWHSVVNSSKVVIQHLIVVCNKKDAMNQKSYGINITSAVLKPCTFLFHWNLTHTFYILCFLFAKCSSSQILVNEKHQTLYFFSKRKAFLRLSARLSAHVRFKLRWEHVRFNENLWQS